MADASLARDPRFADNVNRHANREALDALINARLSRLTRDQAGTLLDTHGIANARLNTVDDLSRHPALRNTPASIGGTTIDIASLPVTPGTPAAVPSLDQHGHAIRQEFA